MSAVPQRNFSVQSFPVPQTRSSYTSRKSRASNKALSRETRQIPVSQNEVTTKLSSNHNFVRRKQVSPRLKSLCLLQKITFGIGSCLMITSALVYASSVPVPQMWSQEYEQLKSLQRQERELTAANETIKNDLLKQAQQEAKEAKYQLSYLRPDSVIFIEKAQINPQSITDSTSKNSPFDSIPLSY